MDTQGSRRLPRVDEVLTTCALQEPCDSLGKALKDICFWGRDEQIPGCPKQFPISDVISARRVRNKAVTILGSSSLSQNGKFPAHSAIIVSFKRRSE